MRPGSQVVRQGSAKPLYAGAIPAQALRLFCVYKVRVVEWYTRDT